MAQKAPRPVCGDRAAGNHGYAGKRPFTRLNPETQVLGRLRRQRQVEQLHALGPRAVAEFLDELDRHLDLGDDLDGRLERYAALDPDVLAAFGGDRFPAAPLRVIGGKP